MSSTSVLSNSLTSPQIFMNPILECCQDGLPHSLEDLEDFSCIKLGITFEQRALRYLNRNTTYARYYTNWAAFNLKQAGFLTNTRKGIYQITQRGKELLASKVTVNNRSIKQFSNDANLNNLNSEIAMNHLEEILPEEIIYTAHQKIINTLAGELLDKIKTAITPKQFEYLVMAVLAAMGYGGGQNRKEELFEVTSYSNDKGIDGIIKEDALGLEKIYIQAKRFTEGPVGRPAVQGFAGSMDGQGGKKGILITTSTFTKDAIEFAASASGKRIILIDGQKLAMLMIENGVGVSEETRYVIHKIDNDYFDDFS